MCFNRRYVLPFSHSIVSFILFTIVNVLRQCIVCYNNVLEFNDLIFVCFQYFVFEYNQSSAVLFDKMITITVSISFILFC